MTDATARGLARLIGLDGLTHAEISARNDLHD
ncbi:hypothetical protein ABIF20_004749 [Bradyrhizobium japonicum]